MSASSATYKTGRAATVTIGSTTYTQAKVFDEPAETAAVVTVLHMGGLQKIPDGMTDFGKFGIVIPEDGGTRLTDTTTNISIVYSDNSGVSCSSVRITRDGGAKAQKGSSADRMVEGEALIRCTWTAAS